MKKLTVLLVFFAITSCIPVKVAPKFKKQDYKIMVAKKFQRKLPRETSFIFKDPKNADEFYYYINKKYDLNNNDVGLNTPFQLNGETFYLSYHEVGKDDETANIGLALVDLVLSEKAGLTVFEDNYSSRKGHWYLIITVYDEDVRNCLLDNHPKKSSIIQYLKDLKQEYLSTQNYEELLLAKKS
ncbi:hypothetical protein [Winogradskyella sp. PG-2]|uniref:hypothetical protein n=1 Tax=Winogradskyella sp. PG-2 TaxID=754409 RepID=UPI00045898B2|nr:hypothetical protein [Winogradskyella sp. PG-2]BAO77219.1 hypothetical protein WPG_2989 [Winogradskyella sp. PG-2]